MSALVGVSFVAGRVTEASDQSAQPEITNLMTTALAEEFTPGREVLVDLVVIPPNTTLDWHRHPGEEFHYYMEGDVEIQLDGKPPIMGKPGTVGHVPYMKRHRAIAGDKGAKALVFRVHTQGEAVRYKDGDPLQKH
ncbi:MAG TPA: cupin domain-containing protein [Candidatus Krumholzibacteria bacterium]|nr:cupin domain-containing protein [Candidatus Krumholzibacteria bacterium]